MYLNEVLWVSKSVCSTLPFFLSHQVLLQHTSNENSLPPFLLYEKFRQLPPLLKNPFTPLFEKPPLLFSFVPSPLNPGSPLFFFFLHFFFCPLLHFFFCPLLFFFRLSSLSPKSRFPPNPFFYFVFFVFFYGCHLP